MYDKPNKSNGKAMYQNFIKQSFDTKISKGKKEMRSITGFSNEKLEPDFGSFTQLTFDMNNPKYSGSYVGMKKGNKTVIKEPSQIITNTSKSNLLSDK